MPEPSGGAGRGRGHGRGGAALENGRDAGRTILRLKSPSRGHRRGHQSGPAARQVVALHCGCRTPRTQVRSASRRAFPPALQPHFSGNRTWVEKGMLRGLDRPDKPPGGRWSDISGARAGRRHRNLGPAGGLVDAPGPPRVTVPADPHQRRRPQPTTITRSRAGSFPPGAVTRTYVSGVPPRLPKLGGTTTQLTEAILGT